MTRINTNVSSLVAQNTLGRSNASLNQALTRLSTGLRINTGKDDPAGLIASENLRSDITSIRRAISNTDRTTQVIATADSALGQVSSLLNDIRGLITESANEGALSEGQRAANQLQLDSSLEALNRIAQTTTFQGRRLLDGSLDFITEAGTNFGRMTNLQIDQANLGAVGSIAVDIQVTAAATKAQAEIGNIPTAIPAETAEADVTFETAEVQASGTVTLNSGDELTITVLQGGTVDGADGNGISLQFIDDDNTAGGVDSVTFDGSTIVVTADLTAGVGSDDIAAAIAAVNGGNDLAATSDGTADVVAADVGTTANVTSGGLDAGDDVITVTASSSGTDANGVTVTIVEDTGVGTTPTAEIDTNGNIVVTVDDDVATSISAIAAAIDGLVNFSASVTESNGSGDYVGADDTPPSVATLAGGVDGSGGISDDVVIELSGSNGSEVLSFTAGTSVQQLKDAINLLQDATGVEAEVIGDTLRLNSVGYGSNALVDVKVVTEGDGPIPAGTFTTEIGGRVRNNGADVVASVNGVAATGKGNELSINTATLDMSTTAEAGFTGSIRFDITGGGALFQLGPDVVSNQQTRLSIGSVNTGRLGGVSGRLYQLGTGGNASLENDTTTGARIVAEAIDQVTSLRGRLGAFQRTILETNKQALNDTLVNLTDAESSIRDADFASESAALTRAQILVQSGTTVLQIANSNPQNVLALLR